MGFFFSNRIIYFPAVCLFVICGNVSSKGLDYPTIGYRPWINKGFFKTEFLFNEKKAKFESLRMTGSVKYEYLIYAYENHYRLIDESIKLNFFLLDCPISEQLNVSLEKLVSANPDLDIQGKEYRVFVINSQVPNAYSLGDGIIAISLGLLIRIQNEAQLLSVFSHELAHESLNHHESKMLQHADLNTSGEVGDSIDYILEEDNYNVTKMENYLSKVYSRSMEKSRLNELEADSLGLVFYSALHLPISQFSEALLRTRIPTINDSAISILKYLELKGVVIDPLYIYKGETSRLSDLVNYEVFFMDTMHSHPELEVRLKAIARIEDRMTQSHDSAYKTGDMEILRINSLIQLILNSYASYDLGNVVFQSILLKKIYNEQEFSDYMIVISACKALILRQNLEYSKYVGSPGNEFSMTYNEIIFYFQKISQSELLKLTCQLMNLLESPSVADEYGFAAAIFSGYFCMSKDKFNTLRNEYRQIYKNGIFIKDIIYLPKK